MAKDSKLLKKMYLLSESTFQKIKDIEDTERNFTTLDRAMREILYNKKNNTHDKWQKYLNLLNKYIMLRKQLVARHGETTDKKTEDKTQKKVNDHSKKNPFDDIDNTNFPRLSDVFNTDNTVVNPNNFQFNNTIPEEPEPGDKTVDFSKLDIPETLPASTEQYYDADGDFGDNVTLPPISATRAAKESLANNHDVSMRDVSENNKIVTIKWKGQIYTVTELLAKNFRTFIKKVEIKYPMARSVQQSDFANYLTNGTVSVQRQDVKPFSVDRLARKRKVAIPNLAGNKKPKPSTVDEFFPVTKKPTILRASKLGQTGSGLKHVKSKWVSFR